MGQFKGTPGPWRYVASNEHHGPYVTCEWGAGDICDGYVMSNPDSLSVRNGGISKPINHQKDEADANMRLTSAATELLDAQTMGAQLNTPDFLDWMAERLVKVYGESPYIDFVLSLKERAAAGRAAISKALGEP